MSSQSVSAFTPSGPSSSPPNCLLSIDNLRHSYCALRHGQSLANVAKIISSDPAISTVEHGLSEIGHAQAKKAGKIFAEELAPADSAPSWRGVAIFSSDFKRARETAQHLADACLEASIPLYKNEVILETRLRERNFGDLNGGMDGWMDGWSSGRLRPCTNSAAATHSSAGIACALRRSRVS